MRDAMTLPFKKFVKSVPVNKPKRRIFQLLKQSLLTVGIVGLSSMANAEDFKLGLPIDCNLNKDCFIQNLPDMIEGEGAQDPFCKGATYEGHKGVDMRVMSLIDIKLNFPVIAPADGTVKATRDGEEDRIMSSPQDIASVEGKECGNGIVLTHKDGYETQLCHLKQNSIQVQNGNTVKKGDVLAYVGNSGAAEFPHVHLTLRKDGEWIDPITGQRPASVCNLETPKNSLFDKATSAYFSDNTARLMTSGISGQVVDYKKLVQSGAPAALKKNDSAVVGWAWFINLAERDKVRFTLEGPEGVISQNTTEPMDRHKASYSAYSGKKMQPLSGEYQLKTELIRDDETIQESLSVHILE